MSKSTARAPFKSHGSRYAPPDAICKSRECLWRDCREPQFLELQVCRFHALIVHKRVNDILSPAPRADKLPERPEFVYYLMLRPSALKIGMITCLIQRINSLRTDLQYVVALEVGGRELERQRHKQFAAERFGRREDFHVSERLKAHIKALQPQRDELISRATS